MLSSVGLLFLIASVVKAFKSRPDLNPPKLNISKLDSSQILDQYIFVTPYSFVSDADITTLQPSSYIFDANGELIWSGFSYYGGQPLNFQVFPSIGDYDNPVLAAFEGTFNTRAGHGHGHIKILDESYKPLKEIRAGNNFFADIHEFQLVDHTAHALVESYDPLEICLSEYSRDGVDRKWIAEAVFQEIDTSNGEILFQWKSLDHVSPSDSILNLTGSAGTQPYTAWDYFHINSVDKNDHGDYYISARHTSTIYKISGNTGKILWKLSTLNEKSDFEIVGERFQFSFQHHVRFLRRVNQDIEILSFFDNSAYSHGHTISDNEATSKHQELKTANSSSGKIIRVNTKDKTVELLKQLNPPGNISARSQGSLQVLANGNFFINWGSAGAITEYNSEGDVIFHSKLDSGARGSYVQSYRGFKHRWNGNSQEDIAVYHNVEGDNVYVYSSWNGDTNTEKWRIVDEDSNILVEVDRAGFETKSSFKWRETNFKIQSIANGKVLKESDFYKLRSSKKVDYIQGYQFQNFFQWRQINQ